MSTPRAARDADADGGGGSGSETHAHEERLVVERAALRALRDHSSAAYAQLNARFACAERSFATRLEAAAHKCAKLRQLLAGELLVQQPPNETHAPPDETHVMANAGNALVLVLVRDAVAEALVRAVFADGGSALELLLNDFLGALTQALAPGLSQQEAQTPLEQQEKKQPVLLHQLCTAGKLDLIVERFVDMQAEDPRALTCRSCGSWHFRQRSGTGRDGQSERTSTTRIHVVPLNLRSWATLLFELCALQHLGDKQTFDAMREAESSSAIPSDLRAFAVKVLDVQDVQELVVYRDGAAAAAQAVSSLSSASASALASASASASASAKAQPVPMPVPTRLLATRRRCSVAARRWCSPGCTRWTRSREVTAGAAATSALARQVVRERARGLQVFGAHTANASSRLLFSLVEQSI